MAKAGAGRQSGSGPGWLERLLPFIGWFRGYGRQELRADIIGGLTVAVVLVPQSMAYAQLAGLPPYYGLYASLLPPAVAALFGSSRQLATGPVAMVSLMTATALEPLASSGSEGYVAYSFLLALLVGIFQLLLGVLRLGLVVNLLSHAVVKGFTNAAALIIATSQLSKFLGVTAEKAAHHYETVWNVLVAASTRLHWPTLAMGVLALGMMIVLRRINRNLPGVLIAVVVTIVLSWTLGFERNLHGSIARIAAPEVVEDIAAYNDVLGRAEELADKKRAMRSELESARSEQGPGSEEALHLQYQSARLDSKIAELRAEASLIRSRLNAVTFVAVVAEGEEPRFYRQGEAPEGAQTRGSKWRLRVTGKPVDTGRMTFVGGGAVVGGIPEGLPSFVAPSIDFSLVRYLLPMAIIISLVGFMEAISIAKAISAMTNQRLDPNQELIGQGLANITCSFSQAYPVSGSFSRSAVNLQAGALTGMSNVFCSGVVAVVLLLLTPTLYNLPQSVLAAIIIQAAIGLVSVRAFAHAWRVRKEDGIAAVVTFAATLYFAPHLDVGIMVGVLTSVGFWIYRQMRPATLVLSRYADGSYRDAQTHQLERCKHILPLRFNGALFFANAIHLEETVLKQAATMPELKHIVIVGNGIDDIDSAGEELLSSLVRRLRETGYHVYVSGLNDSVLSVLQRTEIYDLIGEENMFRYLASAVEVIRRRSKATAERGCCPDCDCPLTSVRFLAGEPSGPGILTVESRDSVDGG